MLTVKQINEVSFGKAGFSGYKPDDVDHFIDEVASSFQQLEAQRDDALQRSKELAAQNAELSSKNAELQEKLTILAQKIESYREDEDGIKEALLSAQKLAKNNVQDAKDKAEVILQDARESARQILDNAKVEASRAAKEYAVQTDTKRDELEEMKRQVSSFRASLLEMYKKHLEQINHIPNFRQKEQPEESSGDKPEESGQEPEVSVQASAAPEQPQPEPAPVQEPEPAPAPESQPAPVPAPAEPEPVRQESPAVQRPQPTLHDRVDYTREDDLSEVGIDLKTYSNIPESLRREKNSHFSNLEFGDDVDLGNKKRKK